MLGRIQPPELEPGANVPRREEFTPPPLPEDPPAHPADWVDPRTGEVSLTAECFSIPALGPDLTFARSYTGPFPGSSGGGSSSTPPVVGLLGPGWSFSYDQWLQMYVDFNLTEYLGTGGWNTYLFNPADPDAYVESCDGDELIYYDLDEGSWHPETTPATRPSSSG